MAGRDFLTFLSQVLAPGVPLETTPTATNHRADGRMTTAAFCLQHSKRPSICMSILLPSNCSPRLKTWELIVMPLIYLGPLIHPSHDVSAHHIAAGPAAQVSHCIFH